MHFFVLFLFILYLIRLWLACHGGIHPDEAFIWLQSLDPKLLNSTQLPVVHWFSTMGNWVISLFFTPSPEKDGSFIIAQQLSLRIVPYFLTGVAAPILLAKTVEWVQKKPFTSLQGMVVLTAPLFLVGVQFVSPEGLLSFFWILSILLNIRLLRSRKPKSFAGDPTPYRKSSAILLGLCWFFSMLTHPIGILIPVVNVICGLGLLNTIVSSTSLAILTLGYFSADAVSFQLFTQTFNDFWLNLDTIQSQWQWNAIFEYLTLIFISWNPLIFLSILIIPFVELRRFFVTQEKSFFTGNLSTMIFLPLLATLLLGAKNRPIFVDISALSFGAGLIFILSRKTLKTNYQRLIVFFNLLLLAFLFSGSMFIAYSNQQLKMLSPHAREKIIGTSTLENYTNWDKLHFYLFHSVQSSDFPIYVSSPKTYSILKFYDTDANMATHFKQRLHPLYKIQDGSLNLNSKTKKFWLLQQKGISLKDLKIPTPCRLHDRLKKNPNDPKSWQVFACGF